MSAFRQCHGPGPREPTHAGLCGAVDTMRREPCTADNGRIQDDRGTVRHQRQCSLHREKEALHIDVEDRVVELFGYRSEGGIPRYAGIREHDIELALLPLDLR